MRDNQIYEFENFLPDDLCDTIVAWFSTRPKMNVSGRNRLFNGKTIDYSNIQDYTIKRWVNAFKFDATTVAKKYSMKSIYIQITQIWFLGKAAPG